MGTWYIGSLFKHEMNKSLIPSLIVWKIFYFMRYVRCFFLNEILDDLLSSIDQWIPTVEEGFQRDWSQNNVTRYYECSMARWFATGDRLTPWRQLDLPALFAGRAGGTALPEISYCETYNNNAQVGADGGNSRHWELHCGTAEFNCNCGRAACHNT